MSLNAMHVHTMIYSDSQKEAELKLLDIIKNEIDLNDITFLRPDEIRTKNRRIKARKISENCRGYRFQKVYVSHSLVGTKIFQEVIIPKLVPPHYYDETKWGENYNWRDHVHLF